MKKLNIIYVAGVKTFYQQIIMTLDSNLGPYA